VTPRVFAVLILWGGGGPDQYCGADLCLQVFLQRSAVNLLGVVLDVPEFFWSAPDHLQVRTERGAAGGSECNMHSQDAGAVHKLCVF
jgi:hypothetical protein